MPDLVLDHQVLSSVLVAIFGLLASLQTRIGPRVTWPNRLRRRVWPLVHPLAASLGRPLVREDERSEYVCSVTCSRAALQRALHAGEYRHDLLSTLKFVSTGDGLAWERAPWAHRRPRRARYMHHCYVIAAADSRPDFPPQPPQGCQLPPLAQRPYRR